MSLVRRYRVLTSLMVLGAVLLTACGAAVARPAPATPVGWAGATLVQPLPKPEFTLVDQHGGAFDFLARTRGKLTLLYFGYTHCPDACPADMALTAGALHRLAPDIRANIVVVFVTTDPARDTPSVLGAWLDHFDAGFVGLTGTLAQVQAAQRDSGVGIATVESDGHGGYGLDHAAFVIAYTSDGLAHITYPQGVKASDEAQDLMHLATRGWTG